MESYFFLVESKRLFSFRSKSTKIYMRIEDSTLLKFRLFCFEWDGSYRDHFAIHDIAVEAVTWLFTVIVTFFESYKASKARWKVRWIEDNLLTQTKRTLFVWILSRVKNNSHNDWSTTKTPASKTSWPLVSKRSDGRCRSYVQTSTKQASHRCRCSRLGLLHCAAFGCKARQRRLCYSAAGLWCRS